MWPIGSFVDYAFHGFANAKGGGRGGGGGGGRGRGRGGGGSVTDNWKAPDELKTIMAFQIIYFLCLLWQMVMICQRFKSLKTWAERGPFILLLFITVILGTGYATGAAYTRASAIIPKITAYNLNAASTFFMYVDVAFRPAAVLWYIHERGATLCDSRGKLLDLPTPTKIKRIIDWVHVGVTFLLLIVLLALNTHTSIAYELKHISLSQYNTNNLVAKSMSHSVTAFVLSLYINVVATVIGLYRCIRSVKGKDLAISRILGLAVPCFVVLIIIDLIAEIYLSAAPHPNTLGMALAVVIIHGLCQVLIGTALVWTVSVPFKDVRWTKNTVNPIDVMKMEQGHVEQSQPLVANEWNPRNSVQGSPQHQQQGLLDVPRASHDDRSATSTLRSPSPEVARETKA